MTALDALLKTRHPVRVDPFTDCWRCDMKPGTYRLGCCSDCFAELYEEEP